MRKKILFFLDILCSNNNIYTFIHNVIIDVYYIVIHNFLYNILYYLVVQSFEEDKKLAVKYNYYTV